MNKLTLFVNNNGTMEISQSQANGSITIHTFHGAKDFLETKEDIKISAGDMVMLINLYKHIKENDIQNDFINPNGKNRE